MPKCPLIQEQFGSCLPGLRHNQRCIGLKYDFMNGDPLRELLRDIAPYRSLWRSARISGLMVRTDGHWISLGLRVSFSEREPERLKIQEAYDWFAYFDGRCPADHFDSVAEDLVHGRYLTVRADYSVTAGTYARVYLDRKAAGALAGLSEEVFEQGRPPKVPGGPTWNYWGFQKCGALMVSCGTNGAGYALSANGERSIDILSYADQQRLDGKLRAGEPVFDGLGDLMGKLLPGRPSHIFQADPQFQIVAPLPFFLEHPEPTRLRVSAPATTPCDVVGLRFFFGPEGLPASPPRGLRPENAAPSNLGMIQWTVDIPWPEGSTTAKACLFFVDREIDSLEMNRWAAGASLRAVLDDYFDPERHRLREGLGLEFSRAASKLQARQFEAAVARLMSLLGIPLIWYGDWLAEKEHPDLGGMTEVIGRKVAILGECTVSKPEAKFSELHKRADQLTARLGTEAEVIAVVFTSAPTTQSDTAHAAEHQIALVGREVLGQLFNLLQSPDDPSNVLELLRQIRNIPLTLSDWPPEAL